MPRTKQVEQAIDARSLTLPIITVVCVVLASISGTALVMHQISSIDERFNGVAVTLKDMQRKLDTLTNSPLWTPNDMRKWCTSAAQLNKGFVCPTILDLDGR